MTALALAGVAATSAFADTTLKFVSWQKDEPGYRDWWASVISAFEKQHPGVKIEWTKVERGAYSDTMTTLFAGGTPPDIVHLASFEYQKFADNGWLEDLGPYIEKSKLNLQGWAGQETCNWKGQTDCIMMLYTGFVFGYNEDLLNKAGAKVPTNYQEFLDAARKTTRDVNGDGIPDQFGTGHETKGGGGQYLTEMMNYTLDAGAQFTDQNGKVTIDTPQMVEGLTRWKTIVKDGLTPRDLTSADTRQLFADGRIAMKLDGPQLYPIVQKGKARDQIKFGKDPFTPPMGGSSNVLAIAAEIPDDHKQLVWDFIQIATSDPFQSSFAAMTTSPAPDPRADIAEARKKVADFDTIVEAARSASAAHVDRLPKGLEIQFNEFATMMMNEAKRMIINDLDPKDVAKTMQAKAEAIQNQ
nr:sugar ABC transporter substrate-binding protein [Faunimonas pinastri]